MSDRTVRPVSWAPSPAIRLILLSALLWATGAVTVRLMAPTQWLTGPLLWLVLPATIPVGWLTLRLARRVAGGNMDVMTVAGLASAPALLLDGLMFSCVPAMYGAAEDGRRAAAAWLLWFVGATLALAFWQTRSEEAGRAKKTLSP